MYTAREQSQLQTQPNYHKIHKQKVIHIFFFGGFTMFPYFQWLKFKPHAAGWSASFRLRQPWIPSRWNGSPWTFDLHSCHSPTSLGKLGWDWVLRLDQSLKVKRSGKKTLILSTKCEVKGWISAVLKLMEGAKNTRDELPLNRSEANEQCEMYVWHVRPLGVGPKVIQPRQTSGIAWPMTNRNKPCHRDPFALHSS